MVKVKDILNLLENLSQVQIISQEYDEDFELGERILYTGNVLDCRQYTEEEVVFMSAVNPNNVKLYIDEPKQK